MFKNLDKKIKAFNKIITKLNEIEKHFYESGINYRKNYMLPIIDILFEEEIKKKSIFIKKIKNNLKIYFTLTSRITKDFLLSTENIPDHINEPQTTELINRISKKNTNKHLIFGGAFIGDMAMPISQNYKNTKIDKKIHCFEIDKSPLKLLKMNVSKNRIKNINIVQLALHNLDNVYLDYEIKFDGLTKLTQKNKNFSNKRVKTISLDTFCTSKKINEISLIHLDIEEAEFNALKGATKILGRDKLTAPDIIFEYCTPNTYFMNYGILPTNNLPKKYIHAKNSYICKFLIKFGYHIYAIRDFSSNIGRKLKNVELININDIHIKNVPHCYNIYATKNIDNLKKYNLIICKNVHPKLLRHESKKLFWPLSK